MEKMRLNLCELELVETCADTLLMDTSREVKLHRKDMVLMPHIVVEVKVAEYE